MRENAPRRRLAQSVAAVVAGFIVTALLSVADDALLRARWPLGMPALSLGLTGIRSRLS
jgi:hypothetical protein